MPDQLDQAKDLEMLFRQKALGNTLASAAEPEQYIMADQIVCIDCLCPIEAARLAAKPNAARCIHCQQIEEQHGKR